MTRLLAAAFIASLGLPGLAFGADYAPIDCAKAATPADVTVCKTYPLGQAEARMATLFGIAMALVAMGQRGDIGDAQLQWLIAREKCGSDVTCLTKAYNDRIQQLSRVIDEIASRGPY
jgi:uncharacterized protein